MIEDEIRGSTTYRAEVRGRLGVIAAGRHFSGEAAMQMLLRGGNAADAGVAATFAAAVTEISHFGLGGEVPIILYLADRKEVVVISGQGVAPAAASPLTFCNLGIPANGPSAGTVPAVVDALCIVLAEFGTLSLNDVMAPAISLADGFPWYEFLTHYLSPELENIRRYPSGARVYLEGPEGRIPAVGSIFRQPELASTLRALVDEEQRNLSRGRRAAIYAARDRFYRGDIGQQIARAVQDAGGLLTDGDLSAYRGRVERPTQLEFTAHRHRYQVSKTGFWGQGPMLLQTLALLQDFDLMGLGHNSAGYVHIVTEALKLAFADRDAYYGDPEFASVPAEGLLSPAYAGERRNLIDQRVASDDVQPGDPRRFEPSEIPSSVQSLRAHLGAVSSIPRAAGRPIGSRDTTCVNIADAKGNLFSASPSSAWFFGGVFIAGATGIPLGNRMQAFDLDAGHPNVVQAGKRPRTTPSPTVVLRDGQPFVALSGPGGDSQEQQALQVLLNMIVFGMDAQAAVEAPRFNSLHYRESFGARQFQSGMLELENRFPANVVTELTLRGHRVLPVGAFMLDTGMTLAGFDAAHTTVFGAADVRRQRFVTGW